MALVEGHAVVPEAKRRHSRKLTWKPKKGPVTTAVLLKGDFQMGFHVSLGECRFQGLRLERR